MTPECGCFVPAAANAWIDFRWRYRRTFHHNAAVVFMVGGLTFGPPSKANQQDE
jgi:hypothetical protein